LGVVGEKGTIGNPEKGQDPKERTRLLTKKFKGGGKDKRKDIF